MKRLLAGAIRRSISTAQIWRLRMLHRVWGIEAVAHAIRYMRDPLPALKEYGAQIGSNTRIYPGLTIHAARDDFSNLHVGSNVRIVRDCLLDLTETIDISDEAIVSFRCSLITHRNILHSPLVQAGFQPASAPIVIERGAVLLANVTVSMGVTIGECAMAAAGAVIVSDVAPWTMVGGVPAQVLRDLRPARGRPRNGVQPS
jgi:acetyltransferase-like isoleucine patch superfamily enzyme